MLLRQEFYINWHQNIINKLGRFATFFMWKYSHQHMDISDADAEYCAMYEHVGT